ncbi:MAG: beta-galactosidase, partial [Clostridiales bacterium]|nr:beta-galactosidase [Clostridiales bacterium]
AVGIGTVRVAEFTWSIVDPMEGEFNFGFWDGFLDVAQEEGMKVIFGTPTATPPAWLAEKYPEVLNCRKDGVPYRHGMRRHYNYNSPKYRELCSCIVEKIAEHYAARECIIGWQIDNEMNCETDEFYSEADTIAFREFLKKKYGTLEALNEAWGTVVWSQTYSDWEEVCVPRTVVHDDSNNPHQLLDYSRFISESVISFCKMQCDIIRKYAREGDFITTNGIFANLDNHRLADECLDVYTYDSYPNFPNCLEPQGSSPLRDRAWGRNLMETRSVCPHFGIMEQESGALGWNSRMEGPAPKPGQLTLWAMQSIAHGADYVSFFRWRTAPVGTEIYWHGILDYDNRDNRKLKEVKELSGRVARIADIAGSDCKAAFALVKDYDNEFDARYDKWHGRIEEGSETAIFEASQISHTPYDVIYINDETDESDMGKYDVLIYPHPVIISEKRKQALKSWVISGGTLIIGARAGMKDIHGHCPMSPMPGALRDLTHTNVRDWTLRVPLTDQVAMEWDGVPVSTGIFNDILEADRSEMGEQAADANHNAARAAVSRVLATYSSDYYAGQPALIETRCGRGRALHFGGTFTRENAYEFLKYTGILAPFSDLITLPADCELAVREKCAQQDEKRTASQEGRRSGQKEQYFFVLNYSAKEQTITLHCPMTDMDTCESVDGNISIEPYGTRVYKA